MEVINIEKLTLIDGLGYALDDIKANTNADIFAAFSRWFENKPHYVSQGGKKCIHRGDLQLYIRLRTNILKEMQKTK